MAMLLILLDLSRLPHIGTSRVTYICLVFNGLAGYLAGWGILVLPKGTENREETERHDR